MPRFFALAALLGLLSVPLAAQDLPADLTTLAVRPAEPMASPTAQWIQRTLGDDGVIGAGDSLSAPELARRIARLYGNQAAMLTAEVEGDTDRYERTLNRAMLDLRDLAQRPGVLDQARFRELYRSVLTEYEQYHGPDPDLAIERGDVFALRADMFAEAARLDEPLLEDVDLPSSVMATFPMEINRAVEGHIRFLLRKRGHVRSVRHRAETYFPMIEQVLAEEGVPDELKYLAVVESALNPRARSWAGAAGMWQFIPATGRHSGLTVTREWDERLDPEAATRAAARHLNELYAMFGDWQLAISGYNCNPYRIKRELRRAEERLGRKATFWDIYNHIPRETRGYVPAFIATALIMSNPEAFDLPPVGAAPRYEFDLIEVKGGTTLSAVAERAGTSLQTVQALNPALRRSRVPRATSQMIRIPAGHYARHADGLDRLAPSRSATAARTVAYRGANRRVIGFASAQDNARLSAPSSAPLVPVSEVAENVRRAATPARASESAGSETQRIRYRVRRGDTLGRIAQRHGVTVRQLREWNNIRGSMIRIGQRLTIHKARSSRG
ncbi:MAG: transglycosylase SLT domain-containing protein [Bacteroidota bacterium]